MKPSLSPRLMMLLMPDQPLTVISRVISKTRPKPMPSLRFTLTLPRFSANHRYMLQTPH
ncbi:hypothetical protein D3C76_1676280 [compost metagenome]